MKIFILSLIFTISSSLVAGEVIWQGNSRTSDGYIRFVLKKCKAQGKENIKQCLLNTRLFSDVKIEENKGKTIVTIKERWTLIPIPKIEMSSGGDENYGFFVMERNLFGSGKIGVLGASVGDQGSSFFMFLKDPNIAYSDWIGELVLSKAKVQLDATEEDRVTHSFDVNATKAKINLGREIYDNLDLSVALGHKDLAFSQRGPYPAPADTKILVSGFEIEYNKTDFKFYFNEGFYLKSEFLTQLDRSDGLEKSSEWYGIISFQNNIWRDEALQLKLQWVQAFDEQVKDMIKTEGRGIENAGLWPRYAYRVSFDYQIPVYNPSYGTWTIAPFYDYEIYDAYYNRFKNYDSYGVGCYLFLKSIAIPGLGFVIGRNKKFQDTFFSFSVGFGR